MDKKLEEDFGMLKKYLLFLVQKSCFIVVKFNSKCSMFLISFFFRKVWPRLIWFLELFSHCKWDAGGTASINRLKPSGI